MFDYFLNTIYYPFVKYRLHISAIFLFLLINIYTNITQQAISWPVIVSFSVWHFSLYIFDRAYDSKKDAVNQPKEAILEGEKNFFLILSVIGSMLPVPILLYYNLPVLPYLPFIPITFLYTFPIYKHYRAKNILFFKNLYSALLIWTLPLIVVTTFYTNSTHSFFQLFHTYFLGLFIYVLIGEAFWDIRDVNGDKIEKVKTIPVVFGVFTTKIYLILLILCDIVLFGSAVRDSTVLYLFLILLVKPNSPRWLFHLPPLLSLFRFVVPLL